MHDVFISYSSKDKKVAEEICNAFDLSGITYWIDRQGINSGEAFHEKIVKAITDSKITLFLSSVNSNMSEYTIKEIVIAFRKNKHILPFCIDQEPYSDKLEFYLCDLDYVSYYLEKEFAIQKMVEDVRKLLGKEKKKITAALLNKISETQQTQEIDDIELEISYNHGLICLGKYEINVAFRELLIPALANYKDSQIQLAKILRIRQRLIRVNKELFKPAFQKAEEGNSYAQYILSRYYYIVEIDHKKAFHYAQLSASQNSPFGIGMLAACYDMPIGVEHDASLALLYFKKGIALNDLASLRSYGRNNIFGFTFPINVEIGMRLLQKGAELNDGVCMDCIGDIYRLGVTGIEKNEDIAEKWFRKAIEAGHIESYNSLGALFLWKEAGSLKDFKKAQPFFLEGVKYNETNALTSMGNIFYQGYNDEQPNYQKALNMYKKAAEYNDGFAMFMIGNMYYYGIGVNQNNTEAWNWFTKGKQIQNNVCIYMLGNMCLEGNAPGYTKEDAIKFFEEAAHLGTENSALNLYQIFIEGEIVEKNEQKAIEWISKTAKKGNTEAEYICGKHLIDENSEFFDEFLGYEYLKKASEKNNSNAQYELGKMLLKGTYFFKDQEEAKKWLEKAAEQGHSEAKNLLNKKVIPSEIELEEKSETKIKITEILNKANYKTFTDVKIPHHNLPVMACTMDEVLLLCDIVCHEDEIESSIDKLNDIYEQTTALFKETLDEDIHIETLKVIVPAPSTEIGEFINIKLKLFNIQLMSLDEVQDNYMLKCLPLKESSDDEEKENFEAFVEYIETVIEYFIAKL